MIRAVAVELVRAPGGDVPLSVNGPTDRQGAGKERRGRLDAAWNLDPEFVPHPAARGRVLQEQIDRHELADLDEPDQLLVSTRHGPRPGVGGEVPGGKGHVIPAQLLLNPLKSTPGVQRREIQRPSGLFRDRARLLPDPRKVGGREI